MSTLEKKALKRKMLRGGSYGRSMVVELVPTPTGEALFEDVDGILWTVPELHLVQVQENRRQWQLISGEPLKVMEAVGMELVELQSISKLDAAEQEHFMGRYFVRKADTLYTDQTGAEWTFEDVSDLAPAFCSKQREIARRASTERLRNGLGHQPQTATA